MLCLHSAYGALFHFVQRGSDPPKIMPGRMCQINKIAPSPIHVFETSYSVMFLPYENGWGWGLINVHVCYFLAEDEHHFADQLLNFKEDAEDQELANEPSADHPTKEQVTPCHVDRRWFQLAEHQSSLSTELNIINPSRMVKTVGILCHKESP